MWENWNLPIQSPQAQIWGTVVCRCSLTAMPFGVKSTPIFSNPRSSTLAWRPIATSKGRDFFGYCFAGGIHGGNRNLSAGGFDLSHPRIQEKLHPFTAKDVGQLIGQFRVVFRQYRGAGVQDRNVAAQTAKSLSHFNADRSTADDPQTFRNCIDFRKSPGWCNN